MRKRGKTDNHDSEMNSREKKTFQIGLWCTSKEKEYLKRTAHDFGLSASRYLYNLAFKVRHKKRVLPADVLHFKAEIVRLGFNIDLLAKKQLRGELFSSEEIQLLKDAVKEIAEVIVLVKKYLK